MSDTEGGLGTLTEEVRATRALLIAIRKTPETFVLTQAVCRHLLFAQETGSALVLALRKELVFGTHPLLRILLEAVVELLLVVSWPPPGGPSEAAARSMAWDLRQWKRRRQELLRILNTTPEALPGIEAAAARRAGELAEETATHLESVGADPTAFRKAWQEFEVRRPEHWSGKQTLAARLAFVEDRHQDVERVSHFVRRYQFLWGEGSYASHATPRWDLVKFEPGEDGTLQPHSDRTRAEQVEDQAAVAAEFLHNLRKLVEMLPLETAE